LKGKKRVGEKEKNNGEEEEKGIYTAGRYETADSGVV